MVFDDEFSTFPFMRKCTISPNWTDIVQPRSQSGAPENIEIRYTWFNPYIEEYTRENPSHVTRVAPQNNKNTFTLSQSVPHVQEIPVSKGASVSEVHGNTYSNEILNTSDLPKVSFDQQSYNTPSGMTSHEVEKG